MAGGSPTMRTTRGDSKSTCGRFRTSTKGLWQVSTDGGTRPLWARNGQELFYLTATGALMRVGVARTGRRGRRPHRRSCSRAATAPQLSIPAGHTTYRPDGKRFLMIKGRRRRTERNAGQHGRRAQLDGRAEASGAEAVKCGRRLQLAKRELRAGLLLEQPSRRMTDAPSRPSHGESRGARPTRIVPWKHVAPGGAPRSRCTRYRLEFHVHRGSDPPSKQDGAVQQGRPRVAACPAAD